LPRVRSLLLDNHNSKFEEGRNEGREERKANSERWRKDRG
jgi:hypothetical protein